MVTIDVVCCVSLNSVIIYCKMNGMVNLREKKVYDMVSGHFLKIRIFLRLFTEGILSHVQFLAFVISKCTTPLDCVGLPLPFVNPLSGYRENFHFQ